MSDLFLSYSTTSAGVPKYTSFASLPAPAGSSRGDMAVTTDTDTLYEFNGTAWVVVGVAGSTVVAVTDTATIDLTNTSGNLSAAIVNSSITDALVSPTAAIGLSKLATGALPSGITVDSSNIVDGSIVNSDVSPTAAIDASKIADGSVSNAEFQRLDGVTSGIQGQIDGKVAKTGDSVSGDLTFASGFGIESTSAASSLDIGTTSNTATLNLGTGAHTNTINIGTGAGTTTINIGGSGDTVAIAGTLATVNTTNLDVTDKLITVNKGGLASSGFISGISIEEGGSEVGYIRTNATRDGVELKAPAATGNFDFRPGSADTFIISNAATSAKTITIPNVTGTLITTGDTGTVTSTMIANDTIVNDDISPTAAIALSKLATGALPTGITVDTANIIADSVTLDKLGAGALPTDITVASANIVDETITNNDISLTANIARSKLASGTANHVVINDGSGVMTSEATLSPTRGGTGQTSVTTGDILYSSASNVISKLPIGTSGQLLTVSGGVPTWQTGLSDPMTTAGDMIIRDGSNITARLPVGAANTVLTSNGTVPTYAQVTSAMIADGTIVNADISGSTAIDGSKIQSASVSNAGVVTTGSQTFAGIKGFTGTIQLSGVPTTPGVGAVSLTGSTNILKITGESAFALNLSTGALSADRTLTAPNRSGTIITTGDNGTVTSTMIADGTIVNADISASAAIDPSKLSVIPKNWIINGFMQVWQHQTSIASLAHLDILADRFVYGRQGGTFVFSGSRDTDTPNSTIQYSMAIQCATAQGVISAGDESHVRYAIEGHDFKDLVGKTVTLGFWVKALTTGTYCVAFTNSGRDRTYVAEYTINSSATWEYKTITVPMTGTAGGTWDYTTGQGLGIRFALLVGSTYQTTAGAWNTGNFVGTSNQTNTAGTTSRYLKIAGVTLNVGSSAFTFSPPNYAETLQSCLRYRRVWTVETGGVNVAQGFGGVGLQDVVFNIPVGPMRASPTFSYAGVLNTDIVLADMVTGTNTTLIGLTNFSRNVNTVIVQANTNALAVTAGRGYSLRIATTSGVLIANAEL